VSSEEAQRIREMVRVTFESAVSYEFLPFVQTPIPGLMTMEQVKYLVGVLGTENQAWIDRECGYYHRHQDVLVDDLDSMFYLRGIIEKESNLPDHVARAWGLKK
jgi:hypothetical protein